MTPNPIARVVTLAWAPVIALLASLGGCSVTRATGSAAAASGEDGATAPVVVGTWDDAGVLVPAPSDPDGSAPSAATDAPPGPPPTATFLTIDTSQYLSSGDGGVLVATSDTAGPNETFTLIDLNGGGAMSSGDLVRLATASGNYLSAADGGGGALAFSVTAPGDDETFVLVRLAGAGQVSPGDQVALQTKVTGNYVSAIDGGGGAVLANAPWDRAWETFTLGIDGVATVDAGGASVDAGGASAARQKVIAWLTQTSGHHTAIGVEDKDSSNPQADSDTMAQMAGDGKNPSFWSADWGFGAGTVADRPLIVTEGEKQWGEGAIVQYIYHACPLTMNEDCQWTDIDGSSLTDAQWSDLTTPGGTLYQAWLGRLDTIAVFFQQLKDAGVAPLFRPLHEINGSWAWWQGRPGPTGSLKLYQITHDYLVNTKGLDNIVWVWNVQDYTTLATDVTNYNPGPSYFDVAALDVYDTGYTQGNYTAMLGAANGKPIGVAECETLPGTDVLAQQPEWAYVAMWPDFFSDDTSQIPALFNDAQVVTLGAMPGWQ